MKWARRHWRLIMEILLAIALLTSLGTHRGDHQSHHRQSQGGIILLANDGMTPDPSQPSVAVNWCAQPHRHGSACIQVKGIAVVAGAWRTTRGHKLRAVKVRGTFEHNPLYQLHIARMPGKCIGTNPGNQTAMKQPCGTGGVGTVFALTPGFHLISRYWTLFHGNLDGAHNYLLTSARPGHLLTYKVDGGTTRAQFWAPCSHDVCGITGGSA
jgi:hypothetical protein